MNTEPVNQGQRPQMPQSSEPLHPSYISYMLRLWAATTSYRDGNKDGQAPWRVSLESPFTQEQVHFADVQSLSAFLLVVTGQAIPDSVPGSDGSEAQSIGV